MNQFSQYRPVTGISRVVNACQIQIPARESDSFDPVIQQGNIQGSKQNRIGFRIVHGARNSIAAKGSLQLRQHPVSFLPGLWIKDVVQVQITAGQDDQVGVQAFDLRQRCALAAGDMFALHIRELYDTQRPVRENAGEEIDILLVVRRNGSTYNPSSSQTDKTACRAIPNITSARTSSGLPETIFQGTG